MIKIEWLVGGDLEYHCAIVSDRATLYNLCYLLQHNVIVRQFKVEGSTPSSYGYSATMFSKWVTTFSYTEE